VLRELIDAGTVGDIVSVEHLEPVGWWHHAHSYVRGNWRREDESTFMLMAKSVHDIDWLAHIVDLPAARVSSFGSLMHFRPENRPAGAADRCLDCGVEPSCPYSAPRLYLSCLQPDRPNRWPLSVVTSSRTREGVLSALREGPYGRCVYGCDNDVVDHQVVGIEYQGGATASFTMVAFSPHMFRRTRIFGSHGSLEGDGTSIRLTDFRTGRESLIDVPTSGGPGADDGHGGGDEGLVRAFTQAVRSGRSAPYLASAAESLASHRLTWSAERARLTGTVVELNSSPVGG
jgi:predicted dehydrogenase